MKKKKNIRKQKNENKMKIQQSMLPLQEKRAYELGLLEKTMWH